ncbi:MAG: S24 family peptidase [Bifidobacteriaceae bacterium]|jgi:DNA polymerase V|nr:S24 family peptidase [Bifidobacteriaceae bacterium]
MSLPPSVRSFARLRVAPVPLRIPRALEAVHAGFPSVAQDYFLHEFSFDGNVIKHPDTTFAVTVAGDSMEGTGIFDSDLLLVDRSLTAHDGDIVIAVVDGEMTVKRLCTPPGQRPYLHPENAKYPNIRIDDDTQLSIWGVVIGNYHFQYKRP